MRTIVAALAVLAAAVPAAMAGWSTIASDVGTAATGIYFTDATTGFLPADENGAGAEIVKSTDGGKTWTTNEPHQGGLLFLDVAGYGENIVVAGALGEEYSIDGGAYFNTSLGGGSGQCVRAVGARGNPDAIAVVGEFGLFNPKNGVAMSTDGGAIFTTFDAKLFTDARYGAFPSAKTWYISAGNWPEANDDKPSNDDFAPKNDDFSDAPSTITRTPRFELRKTAKGGYKPYVRLPGRDAMVTGNETIFQAQISLSTDAGKTWNSVFENKGDFYANGIACIDDNNCCFVGEADAGAAAGARIHCTNDAGANWNRTLFLPGPQNSLLDITATGTAGEYWAVGGTLSSLDANATFYHSTNSGNSWTLDSTISGSYASAVDCRLPPPVIRESTAPSCCAIDGF
ncbi:hypothetical protein FNF28_01977 [Cafeteria roenbergensis]|uniref:Photosynthesis system II assembly factor Ycf48/Hcf136-like domain-containing protein n=1 Tax=Cafeteria roenbergensis TaxID=33653 RepID=A0A5A8DVN9_CAFRO|nr:hypothetical protein FNF28_01977 [Cafeteria roenbergensis]